MTRAARLMAAAVLLIAGSAPAAQTPATQAPAFDAARAAGEVIDALNAGRFGDVVARFDAAMTAAMPEARLRMTWALALQQAGAFVKRGEPRVVPRGDISVTITPCEFARAAIDVQFAFNASGQITGFTMRPAAASAPVTPYTPPAYAAANAVEEDVTVGAGGDWPLPGTLTLPASGGPFPAVVLVHGSGPHDRDETIGPSKPFRDLALGLAAQGVAVLRYEKRSRQFAQKLAGVAGMTVKDEVVDDAIAAVAALRRHPKIDPRRIVVLGHSLGGMLIPRIAAREPQAAAFVVLAGAARPIEDAILEQTKYIASLDGAISPAEQKAIDDASALGARVRSLTAANASEPALISGAPASYWLDLRGYDAPAAAVRIGRPVLVLQGERDYQVTMAEFAKWQTALTGPGVAPGTRATFKAYPGLNHLFAPGTGPGAPADYAVLQHVDAPVVRDIADFVKQATSGSAAGR